MNQNRSSTSNIDTFLYLINNKQVLLMKVPISNICQHILLQYSDSSIFPRPASVAPKAKQISLLPYFP